MIKLRTVLDNSGQFWTVLDKMLCYNGRVKDDGSELSFVYGLLSAQRIFAGCRTVRLVRNVRRAPQKVIVTLPGANRPLKVVSQCRTMSHDVA